MNIDQRSQPAGLNSTHGLSLAKDLILASDRAIGSRQIKFIFVYFYTLYLVNIMLLLVSLVAFVPILYLLYLLPESFYLRVRVKLSIL